MKRLQLLLCLLIYSAAVAFAQTDALRVRALQNADPNFFTLGIEGAAGAAITVQSSTNLVDWDHVTNLTATAPRALTFPLVTEGALYYRALAAAAPDPTGDAPANDLFSNATLLEGTNIVITGNLAKATAEPSEPDHSGNAAAHTVWHSWVAPTNGVAVARVHGSGLGALGVAVYTGESLASLVKVAQSGPASIHANFQARVGETYFIAVDDEMVPGEFSLYLKFGQEPTLRFVWPKEGETVYFHGATNLVIQMEAFDLDGSHLAFNFMWRGESFRPTQTDYFSAPRPVTIPNADRETYWNVTASSHSSVGPLSATRSFMMAPAPPPNDDLANAIILTNYDARIAVRTPGGTAEPFEQISGSVMGGSAWFKWRAPASATVSVRATPSRSGDQPSIVIYQGAAYPLTNRVASGSHSVSFTPKAGSEYSIRVSSSLGSPLNFSIGIPAEPPVIRWVTPTTNDVFQFPTNILFEIDASDATGRVTQVVLLHEGFPIARATEGPFKFEFAPLSDGLHNFTAVAINDSGAISATPTLSLKIDPPPPFYDDFADALSMFDYPLYVDNRWATPEAGEPAHLLSGPGKSVWLSWLATKTTDVELSFHARTNDSISVYTGESLTNLTLIAQDATATNDTLRFPAVEGTRYSIAASSDEPNRWQLLIDSVVKPVVQIVEPQPGATFSAGSDVLVRLSVAAHEEAIQSVDFSAGFELLGTVKQSPFELWWRNVPASAAPIPVIARVNRGSGMQINADPVLVQVIDVVSANDHFENARVIDGTLHDDSVSIAMATGEMGEPAHGGAAATNSVWWRWTAPRAGPFTVVCDVNQKVGTVAVYTGDSLQSLEPVGSAYHPRNAASQAGVTFQAESGRVYHFAVQGGSGSIRNAHLGLRPSAPPVIRMSEPLSGSAWATHQQVPLGIQAVEAGAPIARVDYFGGPSSARSFVPPFGAKFTAPPHATTFTNLHAVAIDAFGLEGVSPPVTVTIEQPPVANDDFADAIRVETFPYEWRTTPGAATAEDGEPMHHGKSPEASVWFTLVAPADGHIRLFGIGGDSRLSVYTGDRLDNLVKHASAARTVSITFATTTFAATANTTYHVALDGTPRSLIAELEPPVATTFAQPIQGQIFTGPSNVLLELGADDPAHVAKVEFLSIDAGGRVNFFLGSATAYPFTTVFRDRFPAPQPYKVRAVTTTHLGAIYTNSVSFTVAESAAPTNDHFENRATIAMTNQTFDATTSRASAEASEPSHAGQLSHRSVWWTLVPDSDAILKLSAVATSAAPSLAVYTGTELALLHNVANSNGAAGGLTNTVTFQATAGTTYQIAANSQAGGTTFSIALETAQ